MYKGPAKTLSGSIVISQPRSGSVPKKNQKSPVIKITKDNVDEIYPEIDFEITKYNPELTEKYNISKSQFYRIRDEKRKYKAMKESDEYRVKNAILEDRLRNGPKIATSESITKPAPDTRDITLSLSEVSDFSKDPEKPKRTYNKKSKKSSLSISDVSDVFVEPPKKPDLIVSETNDFSKEPVEKSKLRLGTINVIERQRPKRSLWNKSPSEIKLEETKNKPKDITLSTQKTAEKHIPEKVIEIKPPVIKPGLAQEFFYKSTYPDIKLQDPVIKSALIKAALINDLMTKKKYKKRVGPFNGTATKVAVKNRKTKKMRKFKK